MGSVSGKKAIVLGGTSGIGLATTEMLRDAGAEVIAGSRREYEIDGVECVQIDVQDRDGLQALRRLQERSPSLVIVDLSLPTVSGVDVVRSLRRRGDEVPVLVVSGSQPCIVLRCLPAISTTPQPPGPGLPLQAPSV